MASSASDVQSAVSERALERDGEGASLSPAVPQQEPQRVQPLSQPESFEVTATRFRQESDAKLKELQAAREEADRIDALIKKDVEKIADIQRRLGENKAKVDAIVTQYNQQKKEIQQRVQLNSHLPGPANLIGPSVHAPIEQLSRAFWGFLGYSGTESAVRDSDALSTGSNAPSIDSDRDEEAAGIVVADETASAEGTVSATVATLLAQIDKKCDQELEPCILELKAIEKDEKEFILDRRQALTENIQKQNKLFKELVEIVYGFLEKQVVAEADKEGKNPSLERTLQGLKSAINRDTDEQSTSVSQELESKRAQLRIDKQALLEYLMQFISVETSSRKTSESVVGESIVGEIAKFVTTSTALSVNHSPMKKINTGQRLVATDLSEDLPPMTFREIGLIADLHTQKKRVLVETAPLKVDIGPDERFAELQRKVAELEAQHAAAEKRAAENASAAKEAKKLQELAAQMASRMQKLQTTNKALTGQLEAATLEVGRLTALNSRLMTAALPSGAQSPRDPKEKRGSTRVMRPGQSNVSGSPEDVD